MYQFLMYSIIHLFSLLSIIALYLIKYTKKGLLSIVLTELFLALRIVPGS